MVISFDDFNKKQKELKKYKDLILSKINDYIKFNIEFSDDFIKKRSETLKTFNGVYDFYNDSRKDYFIIQYNYGHNYYRVDELHFTLNDYNDLLYFVKDSEQYKLKKEAEKYNL